MANNKFFKLKKYLRFGFFVVVAVFIVIAPIKLFTSLSATSEHFVDGFPTSASEIRELKRRTLTEISNFTKNYMGIQNRNFDNTLSNWNAFRGNIIDRNFLLSSLGIANADESVVDAGKEAATSLSVALIMNLNQLILPTIISYLEKTPFDSLTRAQRNIAYLQLSEMPSSTLPVELANREEKLKQALLQFPMDAFDYKEGNAKEKISTDGSFSTLTLNVCSFAGVLPMLYGGPAPWKERIDSLSKRIQDADADVVCLQEVFDPEAGVALYQRLKDQYRYFYTDIGPRVDIIGISSGLFVASKYKIENPNFTLFSDREKVRAYGFFDFDIKSEDQILGHITTTHLQPYRTDKGIELREKEFSQIVKNLQAKAESKQVPFFLCGDMNIQWGSNEPAEQLLRANFIDNYNKDRESVAKDERTCLDFTDYWWKANRDPSALNSDVELIDYALLLKTDQSKNYQMETKRVPMGEITTESLPDTDHDGLFSQIRNKAAKTKEE